MHMLDGKPAGDAKGASRDVQRPAASSPPPGTDVPFDDDIPF
jgi:hypothetical protein